MKKGLAALLLTTTCLWTALATSAAVERLKSEAPEPENGNNFTIDGMTYHPTTLLGEECGRVTLEKVSEKFIADAAESKVLAFPEEVEYDGRKYLLCLIADRVLEGFDLTPIEEIVFPQWLEMPGAGNYNDMPNLTKVVFGKNMLTTGLQNFTTCRC